MNKSSFAVIAIVTLAGLFLMDAYKRGKKIQEQRATLDSVNTFIKNFDGATIAKDSMIHSRNRAVVKSHIAAIEVRYNFLAAPNPTISKHITTAKDMFHMYQENSDTAYAQAAISELRKADELLV